MQRLATRVKALLSTTDPAYSETEIDALIAQARALARFAVDLCDGLVEPIEQQQGHQPDRCEDVDAVTAAAEALAQLTAISVDDAERLARDYYNSERGR